VIPGTSQEVRGFVENVNRIETAVEDHERIGMAVPGQSGFPGELSTLGITSLVLIVHPYHVREFEMTCEGTENWQGRAAWKVRFAQRMD